MSRQDRFVRSAWNRLVLVFGCAAALAATGCNRSLLLAGITRTAGDLTFSPSGQSGNNTENNTTGNNTTGNNTTGNNTSQNGTQSGSNNQAGNNTGGGQTGQGNAPSDEGTSGGTVVQGRGSRGMLSGHQAASMAPFVRPQGASSLWSWLFTGFVAPALATGQGPVRWLSVMVGPATWSWNVVYAEITCQNTSNQVAARFPNSGIHAQSYQHVQVKGWTSAGLEQAQFHSGEPTVHTGSEFSILDTVLAPGKSVSKRVGGSYGHFPKQIEIIAFDIDSTKQGSVQCSPITFWYSGGYSVNTETMGFFHL